MPPDLTAPPKGCRFAPRCRYAQDTCRESEPPLAGETALHSHACFFPVGEAERQRRHRGPGAEAAQGGGR